MKQQKYSKEFFMDWLRTHKRLPSMKTEANLRSNLGLYRRKYPDLDALAKKYRKLPRGAGYVENSDIQKLGLFLAESGGMGWF